VAGAKIAVFGAGAIGCWVGGRLAAGGAEVTLIGRARVIDELAAGLRVVELGGRVFAATPALATDASAARDADIVVVTVKSAATADAGRALAGVLADSAHVVSLQNGVRNVGALRAALPGRHVIAGMVPFNVIRRRDGAYARASAGTLMFEHVDAVAPLSDACLHADLAFDLRDDMPAVQWAKLVMNLNNAINALSGRPLADELADRGFRRCLSAAQREALSVLAASGIPIARLTKLPAPWIARLLVVPDAVFRRLAPRIVAIDPAARSSMWDDLERGRATEVDYIQGEVIELARKLGRDAPVNRRLAELVHAAEAGGRRDYGGRELLEVVTRPR
jgi:2-dehydropantoate 2-reductase